MATDRRLGPHSNESSGANVETGRLVRELVEALMAVGNYLAVANLVGGTKSGPEHLADVLDKSMRQYERAANAARQLHKLYVHESGDDDGPPSFCR